MFHPGCNLRRAPVRRLKEPTVWMESSCMLNRNIELNELLPTVAPPAVAQQILHHTPDVFRAVVEVGKSVRARDTQAFP